MKSLLESGPEHFVRSPFSARRILMSADDGAIDDGAGLIDLDLQLLEDRGPVAGARPVGEAVVDRLPRAEPLRQISPGHAGLGSIQYGFNEQSIASRGRGPRLLSRQDRLKPTPLFVREPVSVHPDL